MGWKRNSEYWQTNEHGYTVTATKGADGWRYSAWGPDRAPGWSYREFQSGKCPHWAGADERAHYPLGVPVPQRCELLGMFQSAAEARSACETAAGLGAAGNAAEAG